MTRTTGTRCDPRSAIDAAPFRLTTYPAHDARHKATFARLMSQALSPADRGEGLCAAGIGNLNPGRARTLTASAARVLAVPIGRLRPWLHNYVCVNSVTSGLAARRQPAAGQPGPAQARTGRAQPPGPQALDWHDERITAEVAGSTCADGVSEGDLNRSPISFSHPKTPGWTCEVQIRCDLTPIARPCYAGLAAGRPE